MRVQISLLLFLQMTRLINAVWEPPYLEPAEGVDVIINSNGRLVIEVDENNVPEQVLGKLTYKGGVPLIQDRNGAVAIDPSTLNFMAMIRFDHQQANRYTSTISAGKDVLKYTIKIRSNRNNAPEFEQNKYNVSISTKNKEKEVILKVYAKDESTVEYYILENTIEVVGSGISKDNKFDLDPKTGELRIIFQVTDDMSGYFIFNILATDSELDDFARVQIYILSDLNIVSLVFKNDTKEVREKDCAIEQITSSEWSYECAIQTIDKYHDNNGKPVDDKTEVIIMCFDEKTNLPIDKKEILRYLDDEDKFAMLQELLLTKANLNLFKEDDPNEGGTEKPPPTMEGAMEETIIMGFQFSGFMMKNSRMLGDKSVKAK